MNPIVWVPVENGVHLVVQGEVEGEAFVAPVVFRFEGGCAYVSFGGGGEFYLSRDIVQHLVSVAGDVKIYVHAISLLGDLSSLLTVIDIQKLEIYKILGAYEYL